MTSIKLIRLINYNTNIYNSYNLPAILLRSLVLYFNAFNCILSHVTFTKRVTFEDKKCEKISNLKKINYRFTELKKNKKITVDSPSVAMRVDKI